MTTETFFTPQMHREVQAYGCTLKQLEQMYQSRVEDVLPDSSREERRTMLIASMLSDVQELTDPELGPVDWSNADQARQILNRAKWILFNK